MPRPLPVGQVIFKSAGLSWKTFFEPLEIEGSFGGRVAKDIKMKSFRNLSNI